LRQIQNAEAVPGLADDEGGDDVGDTMNIESPTTVFHIHEASEQTKGTDPPTTKKRLGKLARLAVGATLIATGASIPFGISAIVSALKPGKEIEQPVSPPVTQPNDARKYLLDLGD